MRISHLRVRPWWLAATTAATLTVSGPAFAAVVAATPVQTREVAQAHDKFDDHDRQNFKDWYDVHKTAPPRGLRDADRFDEKSHVVVGKVIEPSLRQRAYAVPADLRGKLPAPPKGDRYYFVDGQLVLVDGSYTVLDTIEIGR
jgi:Ni/Co efflux regulator RcnB